MRHNDGHKYNGLTENGISVDNSLFLISTSNFFAFCFPPSPHFGFDKPVLAITKFSTFIFESTKVKINKLNSYAHRFCVLRTFHARALTEPKSALQAFGFFQLSITNSLMTPFLINRLGFP